MRIISALGVVGLLFMTAASGAGCSTDARSEASAGGHSPTTSTGGRAASTGGAQNVSGGAPGSGGSAGSSGAPGSGGSAGSSGAAGSSPCDAPNLTWKSANKTNYTSYPDPGSEECIEFNGCTWAGQFAACDGKKSEEWVSAHNIVAAFPDFGALRLHDLCLKKGSKTMVVTVLDTCGDSDCNGCCTQNRGKADQLIDLEHYTNERWGVPDGAIEWADLGPTKGGGCD